MTSLCAKQNKPRKNIKRQLSDLTADINLIIPWRFEARSAVELMIVLRCEFKWSTQHIQGNNNRNILPLEGWV